MNGRPEVDVIVVGSGSAGMTTAIVAAKLGLDVLLVEKTRYVGGISAISGGGCWIPGNPLMKASGQNDSREEAASYLQCTVGAQLRPDMLATFLENAVPMTEFLLNETVVAFEVRGLAPDYFPDNEGSALNRTMQTVDYDGRQLGSWLKALRPAYREFNAPFGMMMGPADLAHFMTATKSWSSFKHIAKLLMRHAWDCAVFGRGTRLTAGQAMMARFLRSALDAGVDVWCESPAVALLVENGAVKGAVIQRNGKNVDVRARRGVVLASGGFSASPDMRRKFYRYGDLHQTIVPEGNTGDGISMALTAGAAMETLNKRNGHWAVVSMLERSDGSVAKCPHFFMDLPKPGCIVVNRNGERFGNEANREFGVTLQDCGSAPVFMICDRRKIRNHGMGLVWPRGLRLREMLQAGYVTSASTIEGLAHKMKIDADGLVRTVAKNNAFAATGVDLDFRRGESEFERSVGDPAHKPNPCLGPIDDPPYYAITIYPGDTGSVTGLRVKANGQVLSASNEPIGGLYACGLDMNSPWAGNSVANGAYHGPNMTFGYIIAQEISRLAAPEAPAVPSSVR